MHDNAAQRCIGCEPHIVQFFNIAGLCHNKLNYEGFTSYYSNATAFNVMMKLGLNEEKENLTVGMTNALLNLALSSTDSYPTTLFHSSN